MVAAKNRRQRADDRDHLQRMGARLKMAFERATM